MAGNRQQSRFLALVGNYDRLSELYDEAANSEGAAALQAAKTMNSIETKINQMKVAFQEFYTSTGVQNLIKGVIDFITQLINRFNDFSKMWDRFPAVALALIGNLIVSIKSISSSLLSFLMGQLDTLKNQIRIKIETGAQEGAEGAKRAIKGITIDSSGAEEQGKIFGKRLATGIGRGLQLAGTVGTMIGLSKEDGKAAGAWALGSGIVSGIGQGLVTGFSVGGPLGGLLGLLAGIATSLPGIISGIQLLTKDAETAAEKLERLEDELKTEEQEALIAKGELDSLTSYREKLLAAKDAQYESAEARQAYIDLSNEIASQFPSLIAGYDAEGNAVISLAEDYDALLKSKTAAYQKELTEQQNVEMEIWKDRAVAAAKISGENGSQFVKQEKLYAAQGLSPDDAVNAWARQLGFGASGFSLNIPFEEAILQAAINEINTQDWSAGASNYILSTLGFPSFMNAFANELNKVFEDSRFTTDKKGEAIEYKGITRFSLGDIDGGNKWFIEEGIDQEKLISILLDLRKTLQPGEKVQLKGWDFLREENGNIVENDYLKILDATYEFTYSGINNILNNWENYRISLDAQIQKRMQDTQLTYAKNMAQVSASTYDDYSIFEKGIWSEVFSEKYQYFLNNPVEGKTAADMLEESAIALEQSVLTLLNDSNNTLKIATASTQFDKISSMSKNEIDYFLLSYQGEDDLDKYIRNLYEQQLYDFYVTKSMAENSFGGEYEDLFNAIDISFASTLYSHLLYYKDLIDAEADKNPFGDAASKAQNNYIGIIKLITSLTTEEQAKAYSILEAADKTTITGWLQLYQELNNLNSTIFNEDVLNSIKNIQFPAMSINLETEWSLYAQDIQTAAETLQTNLQKALDTGMSGEEALALADRLGKNISDFSLEGGKFFYHDTEAIVSSYQNNINELYNNLVTETNKQLNKYLSWQLPEFTDITTDLDKVKTFLESGEYTGTALNEINNAIAMYETGLALNEYQNQIINQVILDSNLITQFYKRIQETFKDQDVSGLINAFKTGDVSLIKDNQEFTRFYYQYISGYTEALANISESITESALELLKNPTDAKGNIRTASFNVSNLREANSILYDSLFNEEGGLIDDKAFELITDDKGNQTLILKNAKALTVGTARLLAMQYDTIEEANNFMAAYFADNTEAYRAEWIKQLSEKPILTQDELIAFGTSIGKTEKEMLAFFQKGVDGLYHFVDEQAGFLDLSSIGIENSREKFKQAALEDAASIIEDIYNADGLADLSQLEDLEQYLISAGVENVDGIIAQVETGVNSIAEYINLLKQLGIDSDIRFEKEAEALEDSLEDNLRTKQFESILSKRAGDKVVVSAISDSLVEFFGSSIQGGILTITSNRDLLASLQSIKNPAELGISTSLEEIAESIQNILNEWNNLLSAGINGSLNEKGVVTLTRDFDLGENSFFRTTEGFGLTESAISSVYTQLKAIDGFAAQISLKALAESAKASDEEFSDIYKTQKKIIKLQEQWAKAEGKRKEELQTQLDIAKEINRSLYSEGNAFNFMNANIPIDITNPLSAWEGISQAMSILAGEDFKEGRMTYENLRAMVEFIDSNDIKLKGYDQNAFMEAIWDSLSVDAEYGSYVDLERLGEMGFAFSADEMMFAIFEAMDKTATEQEAILQKREDIIAAWKEIQNIGGLNLTEGDKGQIISAEGEDQIIKLFNTYKDLAGTSIEWEAFKEMDGAAKAMREIYEAFLISDEQGYEAYVAFMNKAEAGNSLVDERTQTVQELAKSAEIISKALSGEVDIDASATLDQLNKIEEKLKELESRGYEINLVYNVSSKQAEEGTYSVTIEDNGTAETLTTLSGALVALQTNANALASAIEGIDDKSTEVSQTASAISSLQSKIITARINVSVNEDGAAFVSSASFSLSSTQAAMAKGTLMGELGPELVSANGHYFTVGNNGAEFVDLPSDAIVFNHLQTKKLLESGSISSTGKPITNERKAVARAKGNVSGPALANANTLKEAKGVWRRIQEMSGIFSGFGGDAGNGGGAGGDSESTAAYIHDLERWYNLLRQIDKLEQQINLRQQERENFTSGYDYVTSLEKELNLLQKQQKVYAQLADLQKDFYDKRRKDLESTDYAKIFTYDEDGLMQYVDGKGRGLDILATLNQANANGAPLLNNKQQVQYLKDQGFDISNFLVKSDGTKIKENDYAGIIENFWSGIDGWMDELDTLYDDYNDHIISIEETLAAQNEIIQEYIDNQRAVEDKLFQAIEDREQAEIDRFQKNLDATQEATSKYLEGLNRALDKEREMYNRNEEDAETTRLQRQLAILQRSGGSASEIRSLQDQIDSRLQDSYFSEQERQIQAVQEASDLQLEKMQQQLDVMNETLEYQKENGLLWQEVSDMMMSWTPEAMMDFIERFTKTYREDSLLENEEKTKETLKELEIWYAKQRENGRSALWETYLEGAKTRYDEKVIEDNELKAKEAYLSALRDNKTEAEAGAAADEIFNNIKKPQDMNAGNSNEPDNNKETIETPVKKSYYIATYSSLSGSGQTIGYFTENEARKAAMAAIDAATDAYFKSHPEKRGSSDLGRTIDQMKKSIIIKKYAKGGLVDFTGPAWVDGTKSKPEAFLSAEDTALLKSKIFSNSNYSLKSVIEMLESLGRTFSSIDNSSNNREVVFENVEVNIAANAIASDYDARRAGEQVLEELMSIARRNSNIGVARR